MLYHNLVHNWVQLGYIPRYTFVTKICHILCISPGNLIYLQCTLYTVQCRHCTICIIQCTICTMYFMIYSESLQGEMTTVSQRLLLVVSTSWALCLVITCWLFWKYNIAMCTIRTQLLKYIQRLLRIFDDILKRISFVGYSLNYISLYNGRLFYEARARVVNMCTGQPQLPNTFVYMPDDRRTWITYIRHKNNCQKI